MTNTNQIQLREYSPETILRFLLQNLSLSNDDYMTVAKKRIGLMMLGVGEEAIEELCRETKLDKQLIVEQVGARAVRERKALEREK